MLETSYSITGKVRPSPADPQVSSIAPHLADLLLDHNEEFRRVWDNHEIGIRPHDIKHFNHPEVGALELNCQRLVDPDQAHSLMVYTATPGSESHEKLQMLSVIGAQTLR